MQYKVPQDVQREDTIIGTLTLKQMGILGIGGGISYAIYITLATSWEYGIWLPPTSIAVITTLAFAFLRIHNMPFYLYLMNLAEYNILPKRRSWTQGTGKPFIPPFEEEKETKKKIETAPKKQKKSIEELSNILDAQGKHDKLQSIVNKNYNK